MRMGLKNKLKIIHAESYEKGMEFALSFSKNGRERERGQKRNKKISSFQSAAKKKNYLKSFRYNFAFFMP